jgi:hypothetical protein
VRIVRTEGSFALIMSRTNSIAASGYSARRLGRERDGRRKLFMGLEQTTCVFTHTFHNGLIVGLAQPTS